MWRLRGRRCRFTRAVFCIVRVAVRYRVLELSVLLIPPLFMVKALTRAVFVDGKSDVK